MKFQISLLSLMVISALTACGGGGESSSQNNTNQSATQTAPTIPETKTIALDMLGGRVAIPVEFVDAKTQEPITQPIYFTGHGNGSPNVFESTNIGSEQIEGQSVVFIKADIAKTASKENPVKFRLLATADDYFSSSIDVIYDGTEPTIRKIALVSKAAPPQGVAVAVQKNAKADQSGQLTTALDLTATSTDSESKDTTASFSLPVGTILKDATGVPLTGDLKVSIGYFSPKAENIGEIFPGGLNPDFVRVRDTNGQWVNQEDGYFITAGLLAVDIVDDAGRKAHLLTNNRANMTIQTPAGFINPETNQPVKDGDQIPVWSHNERTGLWQWESTGTFKQQANGNFSVSYTVNHLSYWNLDWYGNRCNTIPISFNQAFSAQVQVRVSTDYGLLTSGSINNSNQLTGLYNVPNDRPVTIAVYHNNQVVGSTTKPANTCSALRINLSALPVPRVVPAQVILTAPQGFTKDQISNILNGMSSLTAAQRQAVLNYTHPNGSTAIFKPTQTDYQKLKEVALSNSQISTLQTFLALRFTVNGYLFTRDSDNNYHYGQLSNTGGFNFILPTKDINLKAKETISYQWFNWWSNTYQTYSYEIHNTYLYGYVINNNGNWQYFYIPLDKPHQIKKDDTKTTIVFEDLNAIQRAVTYLRSQGL